MKQKKNIPKRHNDRVLIQTDNKCRTRNEVVTNNWQLKKTYEFTIWGVHSTYPNEHKNDFLWLKM